MSALRREAVAVACIAVVAGREPALIDRGITFRETSGGISLVRVAGRAGYRPADLSLNGSKSGRVCADSPVDYQPELIQVTPLRQKNRAISISLAKPWSGDR
jgi:hypothetical protein